jgi:nucleotide-binding universal stress UspA family protein
VPESFRILLRSPADITVIERASWWTDARLERAIGTLLLVVVAAIGWIWLLRRRVDAQTATIAEKAHALGAGLIVMGVFGKSRLRELLLGGVSRELLDTSVVPLLLAH